MKADSEAERFNSLLQMERVVRGEERGRRVGRGWVKGRRKGERKVKGEEKEEEEREKKSTQAWNHM